MYVKIHRSPHAEIIALCDEELIGKTIKESDIEFTVSERFFKGDRISDEKILYLLKTAKNVNAVGEKTVAFLLENKVIEKQNIKIIKGIPHAQIFSF